MNLKLGNDIQALILLSSLSYSYETLMVSLSNSTPNGKLILKILKENILKKKGWKRDTYESNVLVIESQGRNQSKFYRGKQDRESNDRKGK
jgi:hypothetical protein